MLKIMIVDDNLSFRKTLGEILSARFPVCLKELAVNGRVRFLKSMDTFRPNILFLDIQSLRSAGAGLTMKIKAAHPDVRVVLLTSFDQEEYRQYAFDCGADFCLLKNTCTPDEVTGIIELIVDTVSFRTFRCRAVVSQNRPDS